MDAPRFASAAQSLRHVFVRDWVLLASIGVHPHERAAPQRIRLNLDLAVEDEEASATAGLLSRRERLSRVVDYEKLVNNVRAIVSAGHVVLVETLAERIAQACFDDQRVRLARIRVEKLDVFPDAVSAGVEIERRRPDLSTL